MIGNEAYQHEVEEENYFVSMTDMMVGLIFIFIILLLYFAIQFRDVTEQLTGAEKTRTQILVEMERSLKSKGVEVSIDTQSGVLRLPDAILFDSGRADLKPEGQEAVRHLAHTLSDILPCYTSSKGDGSQRPPDCPPTEHRIESLFIEGHTDADPLRGAGLLRDNWDLSMVRSTNTYRAVVAERPELLELCVKSVERCEPVLSVSGYGPQRPVSVGLDEVSKQRNRRIDVRLIMVTPDGGETLRKVRKALEEQ